MPKDRTFRSTEHQRRLAERELDFFLEALCHDTQFDIRRSCRLVEILALPARITRAAQLEEVHKLVRLKAERMEWGRPWTLTQLERAYYAKPRGFRRPPPKPVTREELESYEPTIPPIQVARARQARKELERAQQKNRGT